MTVDLLDAGTFKLDGGAMFGVVPKVMWEKKVPADENNLCTWAARCLLIRDKGRVIVVDTGMGDKQDAKFRSHFHPDDGNIVRALAVHGVKPEDVTDVLLTHLHFDHVGGATHFNEDGQIVTTFPNATYYSNEDHWAWAKNPNPREAASFLTENLDPLRASGQLEMLTFDGDKDLHWLPNISLRRLHGHTEAMMMPLIELDGGQRLAYLCDLMPAAAHVREPWVIAYDVRPLKTIEEKRRLTQEALADDYLVAFEHGLEIGLGRFVKNDRGRINVEALEALP